MYARLSASSKRLLPRSSSPLLPVRSLTERRSRQPLPLLSCTFAAAPTHEVVNQATPLENINLYTSDALLQNAVESFGNGAAGWAHDVLAECGQQYGSAETFHQARQANLHRPVLKTHDRFGHRIDSVEFHPHYHQLMALGKKHQLPSFAWNPQLPSANTSDNVVDDAKKQMQKGEGAGRGGGPAAGGGGVSEDVAAETRCLHTARAALPFIGNQVEAGTQCPLTMTYASVPALRHCAAVAADWVPGIVTPVYDPRDIPAPEKKGLTVGMSMTEKQGGSDVRSNTTVARPLQEGNRESGDMYSLTGHKWFTSAPHCDAFLTLAYAEGRGPAEGVGPSCFLVPRWLPDGTRNTGFQLQRLKDKLGDHSNASSEVEYHGAHGRLIGQEGRGVKCIIEMVGLTRLDCTIGSAALMRHALSQAIHHSQGRKAFGAHLADQPLMRNVLADLALDAEAATLLTFRSARGIDDAILARTASDKESSDALSRLLTAVAKYFVCKTAPRFVYEAMECHGGNGYVEVRLWVLEYERVIVDMRDLGQRYIVISVSFALPCLAG